MSETNDIILDIQHVTKEFPGVVALTDVSIPVKRGTIHGICGENGAGKSTLMKILAGVYPFDSYQGRIVYNGEELRFERDSIRQAIVKGIAIVYQELALIPLMTVGENIYLGREPNASGIINWNKLYRETQGILDEYHLAISPTAIVTNLGVGQQQIVEIAKALSESAKVLILDEPTSALTEAEVEILMGILAHLKERGVTCIYISHKVEEFFRITDNITVLRDGGVVGTLATKDATYERIISMMVGREMRERFPIGNRNPGEIILEVRGLSVDSPYQAGKRSVKDVSFSVRKGEILGIAGLMGSGRTRTGNDDLRRVRAEPQRGDPFRGRAGGHRFGARGHGKRHQPRSGGPQANGARRRPVHPQEHVAAEPGAFLRLPVHQQERGAPRM